MRRSWIALLFLALCLAGLTASAAETLPHGYILDEAGLFTASERAEYENAARTLSETYRCGVYFAAVADYTQFADTGAADAAEGMFERYGLGFGTEKDGVLLLVSTKQGSCGLVSDGAATDALGDHQQLLTACVEAYGENGYADILSAYLVCVQEQFQERLTPVSAPAGEGGGLSSYLERLQSLLGENRPQNAPADPQTPRVQANGKEIPALDGYVTDLYGLLSAEERNALEARARTLSAQYGLGVYILIVDNYVRYGTGDAYQAAGDVFLACDLGEGENGAGLLLMLSMRGRDVTILTNKGGHALLGADAKDWIEAKYLPHLKRDAWAKALDAFLSATETALQTAEKGEPMTMLNYPESRGFTVLVAGLGGFGLAYLVMSILRSGMKSVFSAGEADAYIPENGVSITCREDHFSHVTTTKRRIESSSSGGGGSRSSDSRGFSGKSSKF